MFKSKEAEIPLRRSELISPNGVGAITTNSDGVNMLPGALDFWFSEDVKMEDFIIDEDRLRNIFKVDKLCLPPDYRIPQSKFQKLQELNLSLQIPMIRFPNYYYCSHCKIMSKQSEFAKDSKLSCTSCENKFARLIQVPLIVVCEDGHLDDFPWEQWVHRDLSPTCKGPLKLISTGGATLSTMKLVCTACEKERNLKGLTTRESRTLQEQLSSSGHYKCSGRRPWFGSKNTSDSDCTCVPQPILKNATNAYYPQVLSAIYIPIINQFELTQIIEHLKSPNILRKINIYKKSFDDNRLIIGEILNDFPKLNEFDILLMEEALSILESNNEVVKDTEQALNLKLLEHDFLASDKLFDKSEKLKVVPEYNSDNESSLLKKYGISKINLIPKLVETRVLYGFSRLIEPLALSVNPEKIIADGKKQIFINPERNNWLPAYQVYGEGIYIEFDDNLLQLWEDKMQNSERFFKLRERITNAQNSNVSIKENISPRYVLLHTLAHLIVQEIVISSGYSSSSLKERIYVGPNNEINMNGFLIYTASGDSEGTMGGLVRLGQKDKLTQILDKAIQNASWCSSDPVCNEIGLEKGQGRDYLNGAACHNCTYISEISCEEFNKYLDRGMISIYEQKNDYMTFFEYIRQL